MTKEGPCNRGRERDSLRGDGVSAQVPKVGRPVGVGDLNLCVRVEGLENFCQGHVCTRLLVLRRDDFCKTEPLSEFALQEELLLWVRRRAKSFG